MSGSGSGTIYVGGVTGSNADGTLIACYHANGTVSGPAGTTGGVAGWNAKFIDDAIITACYWGGNGQTQGIGNDEAGTGGTTEVTEGNWDDAIKKMSEALEEKDSEWYYIKGSDLLPVLDKRQQ